MTRVDSAQPPRVEGSDRARWRGDALVLALVTVVIRLPAFLADKSLVFDDGVFASSALAMRHGDVPFRDIFSSQGPLFLPLVWLGDLAGFRTLDAPRVLSVASGVVLTIAVYACGRRVTTRANALLAAGLVTTAGSILWVTVPVNADGPSLAFAVLALALALRYRDTPRVTNAVWMGLAAGGAMSIKVLALPAVVVAGLVVLLSHRKVRDAAISVGAAVAVYVVAAVPFGISDVWEQSYSYHQHARRVNTRVEALRKIVSTLWDRDKLVVVALGLALVAFVVRSITCRRKGRPGDRSMTVVACVLIGWSVVLVGLYVWEPALWRAHLSHLIPPLALLAALKPPPWKVLAVAGLVTLPFAIASNSSILWPGGYSGETAALVRHLADFPSGARFISDDPGLVWRSGHDTPGAFADTSYQRIDDRGITQASLVEAASARDVCGVVVTSSMHFERFPGVAAALARIGYHPIRFGEDLVLYQRGSAQRCPERG